MSKDGYYGDFDSFADEQRAYEQWQDLQEPNVVPCKCGKLMYETEETCGSCDSTPPEVQEMKGGK